MKSSNINKIFEIFAKNNPNPKTELNYHNNYTLLVAVLLSAQSTDLMVNKVTEDLFATYDSPQKMLDLGETKLKTYINKLGLFNNKAKNIIALSKILIDRYLGEVPDNLQDLEQLPGVGRKTANVVLNCAFNQDTMPVDTHVFRVSKRIGFSSAENVEKVEKDLLEVIPSKWLNKAHHWLILHGRYICKARKPDCENCKIKQFCDYFRAY